MWNLAEAELWVMGNVLRDVSVGFLKYSGFSVHKDNTQHATKRHDMDLGSYTARLQQYSRHGSPECA
jgi:hypothetical protein